MVKSKIKKVSMAINDDKYDTAEADGETIAKIPKLTNDDLGPLNTDGKDGENSSKGDSSDSGKSNTELTETQRNRIERQRRQAQALAKARLARRNAPKTLDTGGGFLLEEEPTVVVPAVVQPSAPIVTPSEQPRCLRCGTTFAQSFLFDTFGYAACDPCRSDSQDDEELDLVARTDGKKEFLLQDCDIDKREPPLRSMQRRNPHAPRTTMRLYLRAQLRERAHVVWGSDDGLREEKERREEARLKSVAAARGRKLAALRRTLRPPPIREAHQHTFAPETYDEDSDMYSRACLHCPHIETYEKM